jgi:hypothetical protein
MNTLCSRWACRKREQARTARERGAEPKFPTHDPARKNDPLYGPERFTGGSNSMENNNIKAFELNSCPLS